MSFSTSAPRDFGLHHAFPLERPKTIALWLLEQPQAVGCARREVAQLIT
jgi:hypothetical protein